MIGKIKKVFASDADGISLDCLFMSAVVVVGLPVAWFLMLALVRWMMKVG